MIDADTLVIFANTGKEHEETLKFVKECSDQWNIPIVWLEYITQKPLFKVVDFATASRKGEPFEALIEKKGGKYLPNLFQRICTYELKVMTIDRYLKSIGIKEYLTYLGIRADEPKRIARMRENTELPLVSFCVTKADVARFWTTQGFDLNVPKGFGNCDLCFMKGSSYAGQIVNLMRQKPESAQWWINQERATGATFISGLSYEKLLNIALTQKNFDFDDEPELDCFCGG